MHFGIQEFIALLISIRAFVKNAASGFSILYWKPRFKGFISSFVNLISVKFFFQKFAIYEMIWKYGRARQATDVNVIGHVGFACWMTKATHTHTQNM